jgi:hypothetical protein
VCSIFSLSMGLYAILGIGSIFLIGGCYQSRPRVFI